MKYIMYCFGMVLLLVSCSEDKKEPITKPEDYNEYLGTSVRPTYDAAMNEMKFWSARLRPDSSGVGDLGPLAGAYSALFETTGDVDYLKDAEGLYLKAMEISANNKDVYARSLAHNYISQHRFKEAATLLEHSYKGVSSKKATELMLFDVMMEIGEYQEAEQFLNKVKNTSDYNYLIRMAKFRDYKGDLDGAIKYMEKAKTIAESRGSKDLKIWTYSNLGDFYGHAGRIKDAYDHYIKTLELQPDNAYVKKGIAWIAYAYENNSEEASRILDSLMKNDKAPDYYLFLAEIAEENGNWEEAEQLQQKFINQSSYKAYGAMYNTYLIELFADSDPRKALELAQKEVANRATPETFSLLAYATLKNGDKVRALDIIKTKVEGQTFEPMAQYYSVLVHKANGNSKMVTALKAELSEAAFELGPILSSHISEL